MLSVALLIPCMSFPGEQVRTATLSCFSLIISLLQNYKLIINIRGSLLTNGNNPCYSFSGF